MRWSKVDAAVDSRFNLSNLENVGGLPDDNISRYGLAALNGVLDILRPDGFNLRVHRFVDSTHIKTRR